MSETVLVCGSRDWPFEDDDMIYDTIATLARDTVIIHGGARGADILAGYSANYFGMRVDVFRAEWEYYGRAAGPIRNRKMLDEGKPDRVIAFRLRGGSRGTDNMIKQARARNIPVEIIERSR